MSSSGLLEVNLHWVRFSSSSFSPESHLFLLVGVPAQKLFEFERPILLLHYIPGRQRLEELQLGTVPDKPLGGDDTETLAPDLHHLHTAKPVLFKDSPEQGIADVWCCFVGPEVAIITIWKNINNQDQPQ